MKNTIYTIIKSTNIDKCHIATLFLKGRYCESKSAKEDIERSKKKATKIYEGNNQLHASIYADILECLE